MSTLGWQHGQSRNFPWFFRLFRLVVVVAGETYFRFLPAADTAAVADVLVSTSGKALLQNLLSRFEFTHKGEKGKF